jgi:hypothetical protein
MAAAVTAVMDQCHPTEADTVAVVMEEGEAMVADEEEAMVAVAAAVALARTSLASTVT